MKFQWKLHQIEEFAERIEKLRGSLTLATVLAFRTSVESNHEDILGHLRQLQISPPSTTTGNDLHQLQSVIDVLTDVIEHQTVDRLNAIHKQISACLNKIQAVRSQQIADEKKHGREQDLLKWLDFRQIRWRYDAVDEAYQETYNWIFDSGDGSQDWDDFASHLKENRKDPYFINGKAGSGKSTLMKYIVENRKTRETLKVWAGQEQLVVLPFFFWNIGTTLQKSHVGLMRSLLHTVLSMHPELVPAVFPKLFHNWKASDAEIAPDYTELKTAFELMIQKSTYLKLAIMIDGIDEFEGDHRDMSLFLRSLVSPRVKLIVSSRPLNSCLEALEGCPTLRLQDLTRRDMVAFVQGELATHHLMIRLSNQFPDRAPMLAFEVVDKAAGVFLWVKLVVRLLIEGLEDGDDLDELQERLNSLPHDLRELYRRMLDKMTTKNQRQASEVFQIVQLWNKRVHDQQIPGLVLSNSLKAPKECFDVPIEPMDCETFDSTMTFLAKRIRSRCCGLLEVHHVKLRHLKRKERSEDEPVSLDEANKTVVTYMHRTVAEFLDTQVMWEDICAFTKDRNYDPSVRLTSGCLSTIKTAQHLRDVSLQWLLQITMMFCRTATKIPMHVYPRYLMEIDKKMCELKEDLEGPDGDTDYNPQDSMHGGDTDFNPEYTAHWSLNFSGKKLERINYKHASLETFAAASGLYFFPIPSKKPKTDFQWFVNIYYAIASWRERRNDDNYFPELNERIRTLAYLTKQTARFGDTKLIQRLWNEAVRASSLLLDRKDYLNAAELLHTFLNTQKSPQKLWEQSIQAFEAEDIEDDPRHICHKLYDACKELSFEEDQDPDEVIRILEDIHQLVTRLSVPPPTKRPLNHDDDDNDDNNGWRDASDVESSRSFGKRGKRRRVQKPPGWKLPLQWNIPIPIESDQCPLEEWEMREADLALDFDD